mmetsp:Transcript_11196/g.20290  ORF Transcript_11196/g.20290 Transcript_11196/m.20290 type:complete len:219 (+) Transcript_11196:1048-1704(+)
MLLHTKVPLLFHTRSCLCFNIIYVQIVINDKICSIILIGIFCRQQLILVIPKRHILECRRRLCNGRLELIPNMRHWIHSNVFQRCFIFMIVLSNTTLELFHGSLFFICEKCMSRQVLSSGRPIAFIVIGISHSHIAIMVCHNEWINRNDCPVKAQIEFMIVIPRKLVADIRLNNQATGFLLVLLLFQILIHRVKNLMQLLGIGSHHGDSRSIILVGNF